MSQGEGRILHFVSYYAWLIVIQNENVRNTIMHNMNMLIAVTKAPPKSFPLGKKNNLKKSVLIKSLKCSMLDSIKNKWNILI